jgi:hypothetical protein
MRQVAFARLRSRRGVKADAKTPSCLRHDVGGLRLNSAEKAVELVFTHGLSHPDIQSCSEACDWQCANALRTSYTFAFTEGPAMNEPEWNDRVVASLVGQWRLLSFNLENQQSGDVVPVFGPKPKGRLVILPDAFIVLVTAAGRPIPKTDGERAAAFNQIIAYSGPFEIEDDRLKVKVDIAWNEAWGNTVQVRTFKLVNSRLSLVSAWAPSPFDPATTARGILEWEREV